MLAISCSKVANLIMTSLGDLPAPAASQAYQNPMTSGFPQTESYMEFGGSCFNSVDHFELGIDRADGPSIQWMTIPKTAPTANLGATPNPDFLLPSPGFTYDSDCSDGSFYVYIYLSQLNIFLNNFQAGLSVANLNNDVSALKIRGVTNSGLYTDPLYYRSANQITPYLGNLGYPQNALSSTICSTLYFRANSTEIGRVMQITSSNSTPIFAEADTGCTGTSTANFNFTLHADPFNPQQSVYNFHIQGIPSASNMGFPFILNAASIDGGAPISFSKSFIGTLQAEYVDFDFPNALQSGECYEIRIIHGRFDGALGGIDTPTVTITDGAASTIDPSTSNTCTGAALGFQSFTIAASGPYPISETSAYYKTSTLSALVSGGTTAATFVNNIAPRILVGSMNTTVNHVDAYGPDILGRFVVKFYNNTGQMLTLNQIFPSGSPFQFGLAVDTILTSYKINLWNGAAKAYTINNYGTNVSVSAATPTYTDVLGHGAWSFEFESQSPAAFTGNGALHLNFMSTNPNLNSLPILFN